LEMAADCFSQSQTPMSRELGMRLAKCSQRPLKKVQSEDKADQKYQSNNSWVAVRSNATPVRLPI